MRHTRNENQVNWDYALVTIEVRMGCAKATADLKKALEERYPGTVFPAENLLPK